MAVDPDKEDLIARCETLSPRERGVLRKWVHQSAKEIAQELKISENTVRSYANEARQKLGVGSTRKAARLFQEYEEIKSPHQNRRDQFLRVPEEGGEAAASSGGFSTPSGGGQPGAAERKWRSTGLNGIRHWLTTLNFAQWFGLSIVLTLGVILAFSAGAVSLLGVFEVLQQIGALHP